MLAINMGNAFDEFDSFKECGFFFGQVKFKIIMRKNFFMFFYQFIITFFKIR